MPINYNQNRAPSPFYLSLWGVVSEGVMMAGFRNRMKSLRNSWREFDETFNQAPWIWRGYWFFIVMLAILAFFVDFWNFFGI
jgi:hypothetical protein